MPRSIRTSVERHATDNTQVAQHNTLATVFNVPNVCSCLALDVEHGKVAVVVEFKQCRLVDRAHTQLTLDSRNQRRPLEQRAGQRLECPWERKRIWQDGMKTQNTDILLAYQSGETVSEKRRSEEEDS